MKTNITLAFFLFNFFCLSIFAQNRPAVGFELPIVQATTGDTVCLDVTVQDFENILGFQWAILFDTTALEFVAVNDLGVAGSSIQFGTTMIDQGVLLTNLIYSEDFTNGLTLADSTALIQLCLRVKESNRAFAFVAFDDQSTLEPEVFNRDVEMLLGEFQSGGVQILQTLPPDPSELKLSGRAFIDRPCGPITSGFLTMAEGGLPPYEYLWLGEKGDTIAFGNTINSSQVGRYTLQVSDSDGNTVVGSFYLSMLQEQFTSKALVDEVLSIPSSCLEPTGYAEVLLIDTLAPISVEWSTGAATPAISQLAPGEYQVTVSEDGNCTESFTVEIGLDLNLFNDIAYEVSGFETCGDTSATISVFTPYEGLLFGWPGTDTITTNTSIEVTEPGMYELLVFQPSTGCELSIPIDVVQIVGGDFGEYTLTVEDFESCEDSLAIISMESELGLLYTWSTGESSDSIAVTEAGEYSVTITQPKNGCSVVEAFTVSPFTDFGLDYNINVVGFSTCRDTNATIRIVGAPELSFQWNTGDTTSMLIVEDGGTYSVEITNNVTSCKNTEFFDLTVPTISPPILSAECVPQANCPSFFGEVTARMNDGVAPYFFTWSTGRQEASSFSSTISTDFGQAFSVTVTDALGCETVGEIDTVRLDCEDFTPNLLQVRQYLACDNTDSLDQTYLYAEVISSSNPPYVFEWTTGQVDTSYYLSSILFEDDIQYGVTVTDAVGNQQTTFYIDNVKYGCTSDTSAVTFFADRVVYKPGDKFAYPIKVTNYDSLGLGLFTIDWDECVVRLDSLLELSHPDFPDGWLIESSPLRGSYETGFGAEISPNVGPDTVTVQILYFTVVAEDEGVSPLLFSLNEPSVDLNGNPLFPRVEHGVITISSDSSLVQAGDTDDNGFVDQTDLLNIGLFYSQRGPDRRERLTQVAEFCPPWLAQTPVSQINARNIDCNGDGLIDAEDVELILSNWNPAQTIELGNTINPSFELSVEGDSLDGTMENFSMPVMLKPINIQSLEIYGLAFSIVYDPQLVDPNTVWMNSENSWLLENDANGGLFLYRNDPENHQINVALVRTDLTDVMGSGSIGQLNFQLLEGFNGDLSFEIRNVRLINLAEQVFETEGKTTNVTVRTTSSSEQRYLQQAVHISPNPVRDFLNVQYPASLEIERMEVWDMAGRYINAYNNKNQYLDVRDLQSGLYILKLYTNEGKAVKSFLKAK